MIRMGILMILPDLLEKNKIFIAKENNKKDKNFQGFGRKY